MKATEWLKQSGGWLKQNSDLAATFDNPNTRNAIKRQNFQERVEGALLDNAEEFLGFFSKTETDSTFGKFFVGQIFDWFMEQQGSNNHPAA